MSEEIVQATCESYLETMVSACASRRLRTLCDRGGCLSAHTLPTYNAKLRQSLSGAGKHAAKNGHLDTQVVYQIAREGERNIAGSDCETRLLVLCVTLNMTEEELLEAIDYRFQDVYSNRKEWSDEMLAPIYASWCEDKFGIKPAGYLREAVCAFKREQVTVP